MMKVKIAWADNKDEFINSTIEGDWVITKDNELTYVVNDKPPADQIKERFDVVSGKGSTGWLRLFCNEYHPDIDFDEEFGVDEAKVFERYHERFGHDYIEWVAEKQYETLRDELKKRGYEFPWV